MPDPDHSFTNDQADELDDIDAHSIWCNCDDCLAGKLAELYEERWPA